MIDTPANPAGSSSFPPSNRLKVKAEFDYVFSRPNQRCSAGPLQAIFKPTAQAGAATPRLGLVVAKRFLPLAVQRNRVKRLVRERFRQVKAELPPVDIIVRLSRKPDQQLSAGDVAALFGKMQPAGSAAPRR